MSDEKLDWCDVTIDFRVNGREKGQSFGYHGAPMGKALRALLEDIPPDLLEAPVLPRASGSEPPVSPLETRVEGIEATLEGLKADVANLCASVLNTTKALGILSKHMGRPK